MRRIAAFIVIAVLSCAYFISLNKFSRTRNQDSPQIDSLLTADGPTVVIDGVNWKQALHWKFSDGVYPSGWGWGEWEIVDGFLTGRHREGTFAVYFFPFTHGGDVILETKVEFMQGAESGDAEAHLLTRDTREINYESGMTLLANKDQVRLRHMAWKDDYIYGLFSLEKIIDYNNWHVMRFIIHKGRISAFVDDVKVDSKLDSLNVNLPVGIYHEPHLTVANGVARFEYVKVYVAPQ